MKIPHIIGKDSITIYLNGKPYVMSRSHESYGAIEQALKDQDEVTLTNLLNVKATVVNQSNGMVKIVDGDLYFNGEPLHNALVDRIMHLFQNGFNVDSLCRFLENLMQNPSFRAVNELYTFLERCNLPITPDGYFLAYKMVAKDFKDKYSGTMDNSPGKIVEMPRNKVDDNMRNECSYGLHFASREYVTRGGFGSQSGGDKLIVLKIHPADVVAIPADYNFSKGRACKYLVLEEIPWNNEITPYYTGNDEPEEETEEEELDEQQEEETEEEETEGEVTPSRVGSDNPSAVLDENKVRQIRNMLNDGWTLTAVATAMNISRRTVGRIRDGEAWSHVGD